VFRLIIKHLSSVTTEPAVVLVCTRDNVFTYFGVIHMFSSNVSAWRNSWQY